MPSIITIINIITININITITICIIIINITINITISIIMIIVIIIIIMMFSGKSALQVSKKFNIPSRTLYDKVGHHSDHHEKDDEHNDDDGDDKDDDHYNLEQVQKMGIKYKVAHHHDDDAVDVVDVDNHDVFCPGEENGNKHGSTTAAKKHEQQLWKRLRSIFRYVIVILNINIILGIIIMFNYVTNIIVVITI